MKLLPLFLSVTLALATVQAAEPIQMTIVSKTLGEIKGDGPGNSILALGYQHEITSPRDPATGLASGRRQHKPFTIVKAIDRASPLLYQTLTTNGSLSTVTFRFFRAEKAGEKEQYYTVTLKNASVSNIRAWKPNTRDLSADRAGDLEEVSFTYQTITWTFADGGVTAEDSWSSTGVN